MSEASKAARKAMKEKAQRMATGDPHAKVDASDWTPPEPLDADVKTGERPVSPRQFKRGGKVLKVHGDHAKMRADRKPRKSGGRALTADSYLNRDVKEANEERAGTKHTGGFKRGGRTHKNIGGLLDQKLIPLKRGGAAHPDAAEDRQLVKSMVKHDALKVGKKHGGEIHAEGCGCSKCSVSDGELEGTRPTGGRMARKHGGRADAHWIADAVEHKGALHRSLHVPEGEKIPAKKLDKAEHSSNKMVAKRAHFAETLRDMHPSERSARKHGGRAGKGKMNVNIVIAAGGRRPDDMAQSPGDMASPPHPQGLPVTAPPMGPQGALMAGPPPMPPGAPPPGMMPRKSGGRVSKVAREMAEHGGGGGGGLGRLEKIQAYGDQR